MPPASATQDAAAEAAAAAWYARLHADDATPADRAAFGRWLSAEDAHDRAWHDLVATTRRLDEARDDPALLAMMAAARGAAPARSTRWWPVAAAAALVLAIGGTTAVLQRDHATPATIAAADTAYRTPIGRIREITLPDGTRMTLDAASSVRVARFAQTRRVLIERGQAFFKVAHDATHPFVVAVGRDSVTALGTQFVVSAATDRVVVGLIEGSVRVDTPALGRTTILAPGNMLTIGRAGLRLDKGGADGAAGWRKGELTFESTPLAEVAADLNRYSPQQIGFADPRLGKRVFSGVLKTDGGGQALADALSAYGIAHVKTADDHRLVLESD